NTAKQYVDAVAKTALKTTSIIPVKSIQILSEGTSTNTPVKPDLYRNTLMIAGACGAVCAVLEIIIVLILCAFKKPEDHSDDEFEYEKYYGKYAALRAPQPQQFIDDKKHEEEKREDDNVKQSHEPQPQKKHSEPQEMKDILEDFDEDYAEEDEDVFADDALEDEDEPEEAKALQEAAITQEEAGQEPDSQMKVSQQE
ncbi:MAG: hypothetical protein E7E18_00150, partial [Eubacterium sp.]|nr:hypothetical protein [Eubacterium sp.]